MYIAMHLCLSHDLCVPCIDWVLWPRIGQLHLLALLLLPVHHASNITTGLKKIGRAEAIVAYIGHVPCVTTVTWSIQTHETWGAKCRGRECLKSICTETPWYVRVIYTPSLLGPTFIVGGAYGCNRQEWPMLLVPNWAVSFLCDHMTSYKWRGGFSVATQH